MSENPPELSSEQLSAEQKERAEMYQELEQYEAWPKLSPDQQRFIKSSLYLDQRALRHDLLSSLPGYQEKQYGVANYLRSEWFCFAAVAHIEKRIRDEEVEFIQNEFFDGESFEATTIQDIEKKIKEVGFPAVILVVDPNEPEPNPRRIYTHACVALGEKDGVIRTWEKQGYSTPFRITYLAESLSEYPITTRTYIVRPLVITP